MKKTNRNLYLLILLTLALVIPEQGCKKLVEVTAPATNLTQGNVYSTDQTAAGVLTGIFLDMSADLPAGTGTVAPLSYYPGLSADEFTLWSGASNPELSAFYQNALNNNYASEFWNNLYYILYSTNAALEGLSSSTTLSPAVKQQLTGEAKFARAFCYFYLVNLYGDVPLLLSSNTQANVSASRTPAATVWKQIISDLLDAQSLLSPNFLDASLSLNSTERVRPTKWAASALLARAYLYTQDWAYAKAQASTIINNTAQFGLSALNNAFLKASLGNKEAIWQLQPVTVGFNTLDAPLFVITSAGLSDVNPVYVSDGLLGSFESGDLRKTSWLNSIAVSGTTYYFPYKYKVFAVNSAISSPSAMSEFEMVLRLSEQFLIRAEAEANLGDMSSAANDLNIIRSRAGLPASTILTSTATIAQALTAILHERQVELFSEWGHRWLDLKRTKTVDAIMGSPGNASIAKGSTWKSYQQYYPIPLYDLQKDPNLVQNNGY